MRLALHLLLLLVTVPLAAQERSELADLLGAGDDAGFAKAIEPREFVFPEDHGPHPQFRNVWWYVTGNLDSDSGRRFGFELTIFRFSLTPEASTEGWRTDQVYIAHFAITDPEEERFLAAEKISRGAAGLAGASAEPFRVWIDDWTLRAADDGRWRLVASDERIGLDLYFDALKPPVLNGDAGLSQKSSEPGNASYYYTMPRLATVGELRIDDERFPVSGLSWLDREWSTSALSGDQAGWDWFALQFDDGTDLMYYSLRKTDGSEDAQSAGTWVARAGSGRYLSRDEVEIEVTDTWDSPAGGTYPSGWRLKLPAEGLDVSVTPVMANQELFTTVRYWEGAVDVSGTKAGRPITGRGYVELTGYAEAQ